MANIALTAPFFEKDLFRQKILLKKQVLTEGIFFLPDTFCVLSYTALSFSSISGTCLANILSRRLLVFSTLQILQDYHLLLKIQKSGLKNRVEAKNGKKIKAVRFALALKTQGLKSRTKIILLFKHFQCLKNMIVFILYEYVCQPLETKVFLWTTKSHNALSF